MKQVDIKDRIEILKFCDENPEIGARKVAAIMAARLGHPLTHMVVWRIMKRRDDILASSEKQLSTSQVLNHTELDFEKRFAKELDELFTVANVTHELDVTAQAFEEADRLINDEESDVIILEPVVEVSPPTVDLSSQVRKMNINEKNETAKLTKQPKITSFFKSV